MGTTPRPPHTTPPAGSLRDRPLGARTTTCDGADANGATERHGLATKVSITYAGAAGGTGTLDFTGAYHPKGPLTSQDLPGAITQTTQATLDAGR